MKKITLLTLLMAVFFIPTVYLNAQISHGGTPYSFIYKKTTFSEPEYKTVYATNITQLKAEDAVRDKTKSYPWRFGENISVNYNMNNSGTWDILPNGKKIWRLGIYSPGALSINLAFDDFYIPEGGRLFIYNAEKTEIIGAFTHENNKEHRKFATTLIRGESIILEYNEDANVNSQVSISISRVTHGYRNAFDYAEKALGSSGSCNNNVACPVSAGWENEIRSVAMIVSGGSGFCSGALVNNTAEDGTPYFLTADHCYSDPTLWVFWFNWQSATCTNPTTSPAHDDISSATLRARNADSDFLLVELSTTPPAGYNVYYAGWNREDIPSTSSVGIHHPSGDIKKISFDYDPCTSSDYNPAPYLADSHWEIGSWDDGTTEGGSSGSPLFDQNHRVIGQLHGGWASCTSLTQDYYGKFAMSWDRGGTAPTQLMDWLDPAGTNPLVLDGWDPNAPTATLDAQLLQITEPSGQYCGIQQITPTVDIMNKGTATLTSVVVSYDIDGGTVVSQTWTGSLTTNQTATVTFPAITLTAGTHVFNASVSSPNGGVDENPANDNLSQNYDVITNGETVQLDLTTDNYGSETTWELVDDATSTVLYSGGPYSDGASQNFIETWCLPVGCYTFTIYDSYGDGICCAYGSGSYSIDNITTTTNYGSGGTFTTSDVVTFCITASSAPVADFSATPTTICDGGSVVFTDLSTNSPTSWLWSFSPTTVTYINATSATSQNPEVQFDAPGLYTVTLIATNANGADTAIQVDYITVNANLPVSVSIAEDVNPICAGDNVTFTATPVNEGVNPSYQWQVNGGNVGAGGTTYSSTTLSDGDVVTCILTSSETCTSGNPATSNAITMTVNPVLPVSVSISEDVNPICAGDNVTFTATPVNEGVNPSYQWQVNGSNVGTGGTTYSSTTLSDGDVVTCILTSSETCTSGNPATSNAITMTVSSALPVSVSIAEDVNPICAGDNVTFTATPVNEGANPSYQWQVNGSNVGTGGATYSSTTLNDGDVVTCILTSSLACATGNPATSNTITMTVSSTLPVSVSIAEDVNPICAGDNVTFTATPVNEGANPSYQWQVNGSNVGTGGATYSSTTLNDGDVVTCILTSSLTCATGNPATSNTIAMTVNPVLPVSVSIVEDANSICTGDNVTFTATPVNEGVNPSYQWLVNGNNVGTGGATYSSTTLNDGDVVICILTSSETCTSGNPAASNSVTMSVIPDPVAPVSITLSDDTICAGNSVILTANGGSGTTLDWMETSCTGTIIGSTNPITVTPAATTTYYASWSNSCGTSSCVSANVFVDDIPTADFNFSTNFAVVTFTNTSTNAVTYNWDFGDGSTDNTANPTHTYAADGSYTVTLVATNSCGSDTVSYLIDIVTSVESLENGYYFGIYPNPNNGSFTVKYAAQNTDNITFRIYNTNGQLIFNELIKTHNNVIIKDFDMSGYSKGIYQLQIITDSNILNKKVILR